MNKRLLNWSDIEQQCRSIAKEIALLPGELSPDAIIGLSRGGLVPATILAHLLQIREVLVHGYHSYDDDTNLRDPNNEHGSMYQDVVYDLMKSLKGRHILIVDDLCDEGITMQGLTTRLYKKFHPGAVNFMTATLYCKERSIFSPDFVGEWCGNGWIEFPWELKA